MTNAELIAFLQTLPQDALVAYKRYSEQCLLEADAISTDRLCPPRPDGWIENRRPDIEPVMYIIFPGN